MAEEESVLALLAQFTRGFFSLIPKAVAFYRRAVEKQSIKCMRMRLINHAIIGYTILNQLRNHYDVS